MKILTESARLLVFLALLFAFDRAFLLFKYVDQADPFIDSATQKLAVVEAEINREPRAYEAVFLGTSHVQYGIDPTTACPSSQNGCFNFGVGGAIQAVNWYMSLYNILQRHQINLAVIGVDSFALDYDVAFDLPPPRRFEREADPAGGQTFRAAPRSGSDNKSLLRYSLAYRYAPNVLRYLRDVKAGEWSLPIFRQGGNPAAVYFTEYDGFVVHEDTGWVEGRGTAAPDMLRYVGEPFRPTAIEIDVMRNIVALARLNDIPVVTVLLPVSATALEATPAQFADYRAFMRRFAADNGICHLDFAEDLGFDYRDVSLFFDTDHLNARGARRYSAALREKLEQLLMTGACPVGGEADTD